jgi:mannose-6-phosphate isomerase
MQRLDAPIRGYAWGSRTAIAELQGRPPADAPEAELWLGAHPGAPAVLAESGTPLDRAITADPAGLLGGAVAREYGPRLPFLLKVLAAARPLSLQAHPDPAQAAAGFAAEEAAGVPRDAPHRTYVDANHKPELLVAVDEFDALCGFRAPAGSADLLEALDVPALAPVVAALRRPDPTDALRAGVTELLSAAAPGPRSELASPAGPAQPVLPGPLVAAVVAAAAGRPGYELAGELAVEYGGDAGVVLALLLNRVRLRPGDAVWMPAGNLHAYLRGLGVEIMAASDNVLRGGLTPKHVNVPELLRVLRFEVLTDPIVRPVDVAPGVVTWPVPVPDFALFRALVQESPVEIPGDGPRVVLCLRGEVTVDDGMAPVTLRGGTAAFAVAGTKPVVAAGSGEVYQAAVG